MKTIDRFLAAIAFGKGQQVEYTFSSCHNLHDNDFYHCVAAMMAEFMRAWGKCLLREKNIDVGSGNINTFITILREAIKNASDHGSDDGEGKKIQVTIWTGDTGLLASVQDEGTFFKDELTKKHFEEKLPLDHEWTPKNSNNCGIGLKFIYATDKLYVDTATGTLYILWLFK